jgi:hypothetical protein
MSRVGTQNQRDESCRQRDVEEANKQKIRAGRDSERVQRIASRVVAVESPRRQPEERCRRQYESGLFHQSQVKGHPCGNQRGRSPSSIVRR